MSITFRTASRSTHRTTGRITVGLAVMLVMTGLPGAINIASAGAKAATKDGTSLADVVHEIGADTMWAAGYTGAGVDVALIDTGVAPVADLSVTNVFVGPDLSSEGSFEAVAGLDTYGHGTHVAGIIAGRTPGADPLNQRPTDFVGVAPDARIVSLKVADNTGAVEVSQVIAAINWVVQYQHSNGLNIRVLNLSYNVSGGQSELIAALDQAVDNAWNHGIVVVAAAGNEGRGAHALANPAADPRVIAVSAADDSRGKWKIPSWASSGDGIRNPDVVAPGVSVKSLRDPGSRIDIEHPEGRVEGDDQLFLGSGTSQATAVVSGAAALLLEQRPELTPDQVKQLLMATAADAGKPAKFQGSGAIDLSAAMAHASPPGAQAGLASTETLQGAASVKSWSGSSWSGSSWSGSSWSGSSWSGSSWSGSSWSGSSWSGSSWSGSSWSGSSWSGSSWSGSSWSGSSWS